MVKKKILKVVIFAFLFFFFWGGEGGAFWQISCVTHMPLYPGYLNELGDVQKLFMQFYHFNLIQYIGEFQIYSSPPKRKQFQAVPVTQ